MIKKRRSKTKIAAILAGIGLASYGAYRVYKNNKKEEKEDTYDPENIVRLGHFYIQKQAEEGNKYIMNYFEGKKLKEVFDKINEDTPFVKLDVILNNNLKQNLNLKTSGIVELYDVKYIRTMLDIHINDNIYNPPVPVSMIFKKRMETINSIIVENIQIYFENNFNIPEILVILIGSKTNKIMYEYDQLELGNNDEKLPKSIYTNLYHRTFSSNINNIYKHYELMIYIKIYDNNKL